MDCSEVLEQLGDYLDPEARKEMCREIEAHMARCKDCRFEVDTVRKTIVLYQHEQEVPLPTGAFKRLEAALAREYGSGKATAGR